MVAEHHPLVSRYTVLSAHCLISVLCVTNVYNNNNNNNNNNNGVPYNATNCKQTLFLYLLKLTCIRPMHFCQFKRPYVTFIRKFKIVQSWTYGSLNFLYSLVTQSDLTMHQFTDPSLPISCSFCILH